MLTVTAVNVTSPGKGLATYSVRVEINKELIWEGSVEGHDRSNGWQDLLRMIADVGEEQDEQVKIDNEIARAEAIQQMLLERAVDS